MNPRSACLSLYIIYYIIFYYWPLFIVNNNKKYNIYIYSCSYYYYHHVLYYMRIIITIAQHRGRLPLVLNSRQCLYGLRDITLLLRMSFLLLVQQNALALAESERIHPRRVIIPILY